MPKLKLNEGGPQKGRINGKIFEGKKTADGKLIFPCVIISQGLGNLHDKNYYSKEAIQSAANDGVYEGKKAYYDHPTPEEDEQQPGRSVLKTCGHYEDTKAVTGPDGVLELRGNFVPEEGSQVVVKLNHGIQYKKKYPDKDYLGISINGDGEGETLDYDDFIKKAKPNPVEMQKISQVEGQPINYISKLTSAVSADIVTEAGARGRVLTESNKNKKNRSKQMNKFFEAFKKLFTALEKGDKKAQKEAIKLLSKESDEADETDESDEAEMKQAEALAVQIGKAKGVLKKGEKESDEAYEARCVAAALKAVKKSEGDEGDEGDDETPPPKKKGDDSSDDDSDDDEEDDADGDGDDDADDDTPPPKKKGESAKVAALKLEIETLKKKNKESGSDEKEIKLALAKIEVARKERKLMIDEVLRESGLPREVTDVLRTLIKPKQSREEIEKLTERFVAANSKLTESLLSQHASRGFPEIESGEGSANNDECFK